LPDDRLSQKPTNVAVNKANNKISCDWRLCLLSGIQKVFSVSLLPPRSIGEVPCRAVFFYIPTTVDLLANRSEIIGVFWNVVLQKDGNQMDR